MKVLKQALGGLRALTVLAVVAFVAPKTAHALAAALVQIVPGTTTHVGQNESQLVSLLCGNGIAYCGAVDLSGPTSASPYVVPSGYRLIVTDWEWVGNGGAPQGQYTCNNIRNVSGGIFATSGCPNRLGGHNRRLPGGNWGRVRLLTGLPGSERLT
jgi:hypothetical protein